MVPFAPGLQLRVLESLPMGWQKKALMVFAPWLCACAIAAQSQILQIPTTRNIAFFMSFLPVRISWGFREVPGRKKQASCRRGYPFQTHFGAPVLHLTMRLLFRRGTGELRRAMGRFFPVCSLEIGVGFG